MSKTIHAKVVIIGSGPAGYTAAIYAARAMLEPVLIQGLQPGGQLTITTDVENYPGFADVIQGPWLMEQMAEAGGPCRDQDRHRSCQRGRSCPATVPPGLRFRRYLFRRGAGHRDRRAGALARAAIGTEISRLWRVRLRDLRRLLLRGKEVVVIGGGNTAVEEALFLTNFAAKVTVVHRRDTFRAEKILQERLFATRRSTVMWNTAVEEVRGEDNR